jgi:hypothetical protein
MEDPLERRKSGLLETPSRTSKESSRAQHLRKSTHEKPSLKPFRALVNLETALKDTVSAPFRHYPLTTIKTIREGL